MLSSLILVACLSATPCDTCDNVTCPNFPVARAVVAAPLRFVRVVKPVRSVGKFFVEKKPARTIVKGVGKFFVEKKPARTVVKGVGKFFVEKKPARRLLKRAFLPRRCCE